MAGQNYSLLNCWNILIDFHYWLVSAALTLWQQLTQGPRFDNGHQSTQGPSFESAHQCFKLIILYDSSQDACEPSHAFIEPTWI